MAGPSGLCDLLDQVSGDFLELHGDRDSIDEESDSTDATEEDIHGE